MKENTTVKEDWENNHLGEGGLVEKGGRHGLSKLEKLIQLHLLGAHLFGQHTEGMRFQHSPVMPYNQGRTS